VCFWLVAKEYQLCDECRLCTLRQGSIIGEHHVTGFGISANTRKVCAKRHALMYLLSIARSSAALNYGCWMLLGQDTAFGCQSSCMESASADNKSYNSKLKTELPSTDILLQRRQTWWSCNWLHAVETRETWLEPTPQLPSKPLTSHTRNIHLGRHIQAYNMDA